MVKTVIIALLSKRRRTALEFQKALTDLGCIIKTRIGIHDGVLDKCSDVGLVILEVVGSAKEKKALVSRLRAIDGVKVKAVDMRLAPLRKG